MESFGLNILARFPFLKEASDHIKSLNLTIDSILESIAYRTAWERGKQRIKEALEFGEIRDPGFTSEAENINELLSYVISRIIVSAIADAYLVRRYALAEAVFMYNGLKEKDARFVSKVAEQFDLEPEKIDADNIELGVIKYLRFSTAIRAPEYKLVNRNLKSGLVILSKRELARLVQEAFRFKIQSEMPIEIDPELLKRLKPKIKDLNELVNSKKQKYEVTDLGKVSIIRFPPCMKQLLGMTQAGENVPHVGRFGLASFLHHIGLSSEQILGLFSTSPDFDTEKARYQIEHITGKISGTEYTPPSCDTMKSNSICYHPDSVCKRTWMNHPLTYYKYKGRRIRQKNEKKETNVKDRSVKGNGSKDRKQVEDQ